MKDKKNDFSFQGCNARLVVADLFTNNQELMSKLLNRSVQHKLTDVNSYLKACITPDCPGLFIKNPDTDDTKHIDPTLCRLCGVKICPR